MRDRERAVAAQRRAMLARVERRHRKVGIRDRQSENAADGTGTHYRNINHGAQT
jgi:hypothetical protein